LKRLQVRRKLAPFAEEGPLARVFLSYARTDAARAKQLADAIAQAGHQVWWDRDIHGGSRFASAIDQALRDADAVVVLWSEASIESAWVQDEAAEGRDSGRLVPVILGDVRPPLGFRQYQGIELDSGKDDLDRLAELLRAISRCAREEEEDPAAKRGGVAMQDTHSICVLPFANMSGDPEQEYFSDGITEDIITDLSKVSALAVVARNTAFTFKGRAVDVKDVGRTLNVSNVLEGSVRKAGNRLRITAQLIDASSGHHLWAERFDRELTDIFAIQDEISHAIVDALRVKLLPGEKRAIENRGTANVDAYNLYLMARQQWIGGTASDSRRPQVIVRICEQATVLDPNYAEAWALMALAKAELKFWYGEETDALQAAEHALSLNPEIPEALVVTAQYLEGEGRRDEAFRRIEAALKFGPESWEVNREAARMLFRQGRLAEAVPFFEKAASLMDSDYHNPGMLITCYRALGDEENLRRVARIALERCEAALARDPTDTSALAFGASSLAIFGEEQRAREWIQRALLFDPDSLGLRYNLACALVMEIHDPEAALDVLAPYFRDVHSPAHIKHLEADPDFDQIRDHPRFQQMLKSAKERLGLPGSIEPLEGSG
jgi:adenylate cyclase